MLRFLFFGLVGCTTTSLAPFANPEVVPPPDAGSEADPEPALPATPMSSTEPPPAGMPHAPPSPAVPTPPSSPSTPSPVTPSTPAGATCWTEPLDAFADVSDLRQQFTPSTARPLMMSVLQRRFPACADLLDAMSNDPYIDQFLETSSWEAAMDSLGTLCHEETHGWDYQNSVNPTHFRYWMTASQQPQTSWIHGMARSAIHGRVEGSSTFIYHDLYLSGTQGADGLAELLDETTCYVNGLGGILAGAEDGFTFGVSGRDGALAFLYYIELYVDELSVTDPLLYAQLQADADVTDVIRDLWLRTHFLLQQADQIPRLGIEDASIRQLLYRADNQGALEAFLGYGLAASNCLP